MNPLEFADEYAGKKKGTELMMSSARQHFDTRRRAKAGIGSSDLHRRAPGSLSSRLTLACVSHSLQLCSIASINGRGAR